MEKARQMLRKFTGKKYIYLKARGNHAIREALKVLNSERENILVQDQGGWLRYLDYPPKYGYNIVKVRTNYGIIELNDLEEKAKDSAALLYENPAGYIAEQPVHEMYETCKAQNCRVILDITGAIGYDYTITSDVVIASFGREKPVNFGYGGLVASDNPLDIEEDFDLAHAEGLVKHLNELGERQRFLHEKAKEVKQDLEDYKIIHPENKGINVIVAFDSENEKKRITEYCEEKELPYTICPRYIRVMRDAVSIEIKKL